MNLQEYMLSQAGNDSPQYDYIFCGAGASASLLLIQMHQKNLLQDAKVLLIDQERKNSRDKTFCFWSSPEEPIYDDLKSLITHSWESIELPNAEQSNLWPMRYNHISSIDLYIHIQQLAKTCHWQTLTATVNEVGRDDEGPFAISGQHKLRANKIFDSRTPVHQDVQKTQTHIYQSFVGWMIETEDAIIPSGAFRFMDFNIDQLGYTQFVYVLPFSSNSALVEVTRFGSEMIQPSEAEVLLEKYIYHHFGKFVKLDIEQGCIPMSNSKIEHEPIAGITTMGARNYKIKPSTGYAFKNMYYHARELVEVIQKEEKTENLNKNHKEAQKGRFAFYDSLLLDILKNRPSQGKRIFSELLDNVDIKRILKFLDEKTNLKEDVSIFAKIPWSPFFAALYRRITKQTFFRPLILLLVTMSLIYLDNYKVVQSVFGYGLLLLGLIAVGIPHGAVDHLLENGKFNLRKAPVFFVKYLSLVFAMGAVWYILPALAFSLFLAYSSWHFGQADGKIWNMSSIQSMVWGGSVLFYILGTHIDETNSILASMGNLSLALSCPVWALLPWLLWALYRKQTSFFITIIWIMLSSQISLMLAFGLYFIGQHSLSGWQQIQSHLNMSHKRIWLHSLPFHAGAWILMALFYILWPHQQTIQELNRWGVFFIFIACISLPHVIVMHFVYDKKPKQPVV